MEPLTGFFILEGLTFDIIGAYLIVTGLFHVGKFQFFDKDHQEYLNEVIEIIKQVYEIDKSITSFYGKLSLEYSIAKDHLIRRKEVLEDQLKIATDKENLNYKIEKNHAQLEKSLSFGIKGLPFLMGGFILQGIGVITQLI